MEPEDLVYDPEDQFYQAFAAGYRKGGAIRGIKDERAMWDLYIVWLFEEGVGR